VVGFGAVGYAVGLYFMSVATTPLAMSLGAGILLGLALSATSFAVVLGAVGRAVPPEHRAGALGLVAALGSLGQFIMLPIGQGLISTTGWSFSLVGLAVLALIMVPLAVAVAGKPGGTGSLAAQQTLTHALGVAGRHGGYWLLFWGFFVCGFHVMFIATHLPAYLVDRGMPANAGAVALAVVGTANIAGSYLWLHWSGKHSKRLLLSSMYLTRAIAIALFIMVPLSYASVIVFSAVMGFVWLATVPLTTALVGQIFGVRYVSTLFGIVFLGHQIGAFIGTYFAGVIFDATGSYTVVWQISIGLGVLSALMHLPINESSVEPMPVPEQA
jgi:predicted MFS family arabinose efflux permease